jgi:hypothetical protein
MTNTLNNTKTAGTKGLIWFLIKFLLMFLYIYEFNFSAFGLPTLITSRRVAVFALLFIVILRNMFTGHPLFPRVFDRGVVYKSYRSILILHIFLFLYAAFLIFTWGRGVGENIFDFIIKFLLFGMLAVWGFVQLFDSLEDLMRVLLSCTILQSVVILYCVVHPSMGELIDMIFVQEGALDHRSGYAGGIACITAPGLFRFTMGMIASAYFVIKKKSSLYLILYLFLTFIGSMIARTGLFIGLLGLIVILVNYSSQHKTSRVILTVFGTFIIIIIGAYIFRQTNFLELFEFERMKDLLAGDGGGAFFHGYFAGETTAVPPLSWETIVGTGMTSGISGNGNKVNVDGGYLRLYVAYGLVLAIYFYIFMFRRLIKVNRHFVDPDIRNLFLFFTGIVILGEYKEFTIYEQYILCVYFVIAFLAEKTHYLKEV